MNESIKADIRITPACAGKSFQLFVRCDQCRDHPRVCGEKCLYFLGFFGVERITPACAGKSAGRCIVLKKP